MKIPLGRHGNQIYSPAGNWLKECNASRCRCRGHHLWPSLEVCAHVQCFPCRCLQTKHNKSKQNTPVVGIGMKREERKQTKDLGPQDIACVKWHRKQNAAALSPNCFIWVGPKPTSVSTARKYYFVVYHHLSELKNNRARHRKSFWHGDTDAINQFLFLG